MQNLGGICCPICLQYFVKPVTAVCGHTFCEFCLQEYSLFLNYCPICQQEIRDKKMACSNALAQFVQNFIENEHSAEYGDYKERVKRLKQWKQQRDYGQFKVGMKLDVRDDNFIWCQGIVMRIISRIGQTCKFLKIRYENEQSKQEQIRANSWRLAKHRFYTGRKDIPRYSQRK